MMKPMDDIDILQYEDGVIQFFVVAYEHSIWISRKELEILFHVDKAKLDTMLRRVFRRLPKESHIRRFFIPRQHKDAHGDILKEVRPILHYDLETLLQLQTFYPNENASQYIETAQAYAKSLCVSERD